jgi:hypothetical protein
MAVALTVAVTVVVIRWHAQRGVADVARRFHATAISTFFLARQVRGDRSIDA